LAEIQLLCDDGLLIYIQKSKNSYIAWEELEKLYNLKGFSSEFLTIKEFFDSIIDSFNNIEEFLSKVKEIDLELKSREIGLPEKVIIAWVLYNLDDSFEGFTSNIT